MTSEKLVAVRSAIKDATSGKRQAHKQLEKAARDLIASIEEDHPELMASVEVRGNGTMRISVRPRVLPEHVKTFTAADDEGLPF
jgi:hypothetical protein